MRSSEKAPQSACQYIAGAPAAIAHMQQLDTWGAIAHDPAMDHESRQQAVDDVAFYGDMVIRAALESLRTKAATLYEQANENNAVRYAFINRMFAQRIDDGVVLPPYFSYPTVHADHEITQDLVGWLAHAPDDALLAFAHWNQYRMQTLQQRLEREERDKLDLYCLVATSNAIDQGKFPGHVLDILEQAVECADMHVIDVFEAGHYMCSAYCNYDEGRIGMSEFVFATPLISPTALHEYFHYAQRIDGSTLADILVDDPGVDGWSAVPPTDRTVWLDEVVVEHMAAICSGAEPDQIDPRCQNSPTGYYYDARRLFALVRQLFFPHLPANVIAEAAFDRTPDQRWRKQLRAVLSAAGVQPAYPGGIIREISREMGAAISPLHANEILCRWYEKLSADQASQ